MARRHVLALVAALACPGGALADTGDPARGETLFRACKTCHEIGPDARHRTGPRLDALAGRVAGSAEGYRYSPAMRAAGEGRLIWQADTLARFLADPRGTVPKTRMSFRGLPDAQDRHDLVAFLLGSAAATTPDTTILALNGDPEYGEYLSGECTTCHQADGDDAGIPAITGWPEARFVLAMRDYRDKSRDHPVMQMIAARLGDEEIAALAAYFATLEP